ncbi:hypothetical protein MLD38_039698 [Melastoma candidum]|uniref:Uncharacterized protein n=1 Tax=Melastoma candidum TaxID=119954 RepID=A0ACB9L439_9MYRT|nr:hypothetical protein MLD38_039698 [Melastoma candidum]
MSLWKQKPCRAMPDHTGRRGPFAFHRGGRFSPPQHQGRENAAGISSSFVTCGIHFSELGLGSFAEAPRC